MTNMEDRIFLKPHPIIVNKVEVLWIKIYNHIDFCLTHTTIEQLFSCYAIAVWICWSHFNVRVAWQYNYSLLPTKVSHQNKFDQVVWTSTIELKPERSLVYLYIVYIVCFHSLFHKIGDHEFTECNIIIIWAFFR